MRRLIFIIGCYTEQRFIEPIKKEFDNWEVMYQVINGLKIR